MNPKKLLSIIEENPMIEDQDLADSMGEDLITVKDEKKRLEDENIICGYHAVINWDRIGGDHCSAIIQIGAKPERDVGYDRIASRIARYPEVTNLYLMSGTSEFFVFIEGRTIREVSDFVAQKLASIEGVTSTVTCIQLKQYKIAGKVLEEEKHPDERVLVQP